MSTNMSAELQLSVYCCARSIYGLCLNTMHALEMKTGGEGEGSRDTLRGEELKTNNVNHKKQ